MGFEDLVTAGALTNVLKAAADAAVDAIPRLASAVAASSAARTGQAPSASPSASMKDLSCPPELIEKIQGVLKKASIIPVEYRNKNFSTQHKYTRLSYLGSRYALLYIDRSFVDWPDAQTLESTLKDMWAWRDTMVNQNERDICIFVRELDAPFLRIRTNLQSWQEETRVRFVPWRDVAGIERMEKPEEKREWIKDLLGLTGVLLRDKVELEPKDSGHLIQILASLDYFLDQASRRTLLNLCGLQRFATNTLIGQMNPSVAAGTFLTELSGAGRLSKQGDHALGALLRFVHDTVGSLPLADADFIQSMLVKYQLTAQETDEDS